MPIFEHDDKMTAEEFDRQQAALNAKINRLVAEDAERALAGEFFDGGDCWLDGAEDETVYE